MKESFDRLGVTGPDDKRFALTLRGNSILRLNFGNWAVLQFFAPDSQYRVGIAFIDGQVDVTDESGRWSAF